MTAFDQRPKPPELVDGGIVRGEETARGRGPVVSFSHCAGSATERVLPAASRLLHFRSAFRRTAAYLLPPFAIAERQATAEGSSAQVSLQPSPAVALESSHSSSPSSTSEVAPDRPRDARS
jgi:hypothetical protein